MVPCGHQSCLFSFSSQVSFFTFIILVVIKASMIRLCNRNAALVKKTHTKAITHHNIAIISFVTCIRAANVKDNPALQINSLKTYCARNMKGMQICSNSLLNIFCIKLAYINIWGHTRFPNA